MTVMTFELEYRSLNRARGRCGCSVFLPGGTTGGVIVLTELPGNPGPSITNSIEAIATELENTLRLPTLAGYQLVEHYPPNSIRGATYDLVNLGHDGLRFHGPKWRHITEEQFEEMIPGPVRPAEILARWTPKAEGAA